MKTFDKQGNITKQAQKKRYPKYIAYIDCKASCKVGEFTKAMVETELLDAMRTLETAANKRVEDVYLVGIYEKLPETNDISEPLYKMVIGARMDEYSLNGWHFWDNEHNETPHGLSTWHSKDFGMDDIEEWDRNGTLYHERYEEGWKRK